MNNLKSKHFKASILTFVPLNKIIANILNPIYRSPYNHQELEWVFCCRAQLRLHTISFFAIYRKTKDFRASELLCVPINSIIAVILHPILRCLRHSEAELAKMTERKRAWPSGANCPTLEFRLLVFFDSTYKK